MYTGEFIVDKITNSIEEAKTGIIYETDVVLATEKDCKCLFKKDGWRFDWKDEWRKEDRQVYKLVRRNGDGKVEGVISCSALPDQLSFFMHLIEVAPYNLGSKKKYAGVPANLVAYVCKMSFESGFEGFVQFEAKTLLIEHYKKSLRAKLWCGNKMIIYTKAARILVNSYFKNHLL